MKRSIPQIPNGKSIPAEGIKSTTPSPPLITLPDLFLSGQIITANSKDKYVFPLGQTHTLGSTDILDSGATASVLGLQNSGTQILLVSDPKTSLLSNPTITPEPSPNLPPPTISGHTTTPDSMGRYSIDRHNLTPDGAVTISSTTISLAPSESAIVAGTSTRPLTPSITASIGSSPNGTEVQKSAGNAVGARDELWSSSILLLVAFALLLRLDGGSG